MNKEPTIQEKQFYQLMQSGLSWRKIQQTMQITREEARNLFASCRTKSFKGMDSRLTAQEAIQAYYNQKNKIEDRE